MSKERILHTALRLFAQNGYEATSVSTIAGELGMTKAALYKHYKNKQDIFDSIVERMYQLDAQRAEQHKLPQETYAIAPSAYRNATIGQIGEFTLTQFRFWTEDDFACLFRKMLTLEQYRHPKLNELYQSCFVSGPVSYVESLFHEMMEQNIIKKGDARQLAIEFYAPFFLLMSIADTMSDKKEAIKSLETHSKKFLGEQK